MPLTQSNAMASPFNSIEDAIKEIKKGRMVSAKLANGKTVTYDCSLAGNKTKTACK